MEDYNYDYTIGSITRTKLLPTEEESDEPVVVFLEINYMNNLLSTGVFMISINLEDYLRSGDKDGYLDIKDDFLGIKSCGIKTIEVDEARVRFNKESEKYEVYVRLGETDMVSKKFIWKGKVFNNLEDIV
mgnify:CR=1 FL=1|jgi:hypothetical protein